MKEKEIQDYLFNNPHVLFPNKTIQDKAREYSIHGKRIDLLFLVDGIYYIIEIKSVPLQREHIGQVIEYYGIIKRYENFREARMILISPSIPKWRSSFLEEIGIQCIELSELPDSENKISNITQQIKTYTKRVNETFELTNELEPDDNFSLSIIESETISNKFLALVIRLEKDLLPKLDTIFSEYQIVPYRIKRSFSPCFDYEYHEATGYGEPKFYRAGLWFAFRIGFSEDMPPNDLPNISVIFHNAGCDITLNSELLPSQKYFLKQIKKESYKFNELIKAHGNIWLKTYQKYEHQPRSYHWILSDLIPSDKYEAKTILDSYEWHSHQFENNRQYWLQYIADNNLQLTEDQINQLNRQNRNLNLAIRLVDQIHRNHEFWNMPYNNQVSIFLASITKLKAFIDYFIKS